MHPKRSVISLIFPGPSSQNKTEHVYLDFAMKDAEGNAIDFITKTETYVQRASNSAFYFVHNDSMFKYEISLICTASEEIFIYPESTVDLPQSFIPLFVRNNEVLGFHQELRLFYSSKLSDSNSILGNHWHCHEQPFDVPIYHLSCFASFFTVLDSLLCFAFGNVFYCVTNNLDIWTEKFKSQINFM